MPVCARTLLKRLHGGGGLQRNQALSLEVEDVLLLKLLHLDQLLLEGQLLTAKLLLGMEEKRRSDKAGCASKLLAAPGKSVNNFLSFLHLVIFGLLKCKAHPQN